MKTFIQWKGTDVCIDIHCDCGYHSHIDGYFMYHFKCVGCGKYYKAGTEITLTEVTEEEGYGALTDED